MEKIIQRLKLKINKPIVLINENGIITYINKPFEQAYGWTAHDLVQQPLLRIIPPALHDAHNLGFSRFVTTGEKTLIGKPLNLQVVNKAGEILHAIHVIQAVQEGPVWLIGANITLVNETSA